MLVLMQIISVLVKSLSLSIVVLSKKNKYHLKAFKRNAFLTLLWYHAIMVSRYYGYYGINYFASIRMELLPLIIIFLSNFPTTFRLAKNYYFLRKLAESSNNSRDTRKTLNSLVRI